MGLASGRAVSRHDSMMLLRPYLFSTLVSMFVSLLDSRSPFSISLGSFRPMFISQQLSGPCRRQAPFLNNSDKRPRESFP